MHSPSLVIVGRTCCVLALAVVEVAVTVRRPDEGDVVAHPTSKHAELYSKALTVQ
jgi:hypothetical protein